MTCRLSPTDWRDVLYNSVRQANGGLKAAAAHLETRRGVTMHPEYLRTLLRDGAVVYGPMSLREV